MKKSLLLLTTVLIVSFFFSCENKTEKQKTANKQQTLSDAWSWEHIFVKDENCADENLQKCTHVLLDFPVFKEEQMTRANLLVNHYIADVMGYGDAENPALVNLDEAARSLVKDFQGFKKEFPDSPQVWHVRLKSKFTYNQDNLFCLMLVSETYTGGAHSAVNTHYMSFNSKTGEPFYLLDGVRDKELFMQLAEQKFRMRKKISPMASLEKAGYWFQNNKFTLPANIGVDDKGYLLHYNAYEIAPYSMGPTDIRIDFTDLE
ncbi:MAG: DUF3298 and DUF4163 domain-containing protein [Bacteroidales bacterium]|nr:DUF3298 and DUF4163 domain-containing protein [Bacteroidales bacterium]